MTISELSNYNYINLNTFSVSESVVPEMLPDTSIDIGTSQPLDTSYSTTVSTTVTLENVDSDVFCKRCGRLLKDSKSRILGMGPSCYKQYRADRNKQINLFCRKDIGNNTQDG